MVKKQIDYTTLLKTKTFSDIYSCVKQIWGNGKEWSGFSKKPRTRSGFSFFVSSIKAEYTFPHREKIIAKRGDIVYIPTGEVYNVSFIGGGFEPDLLTLNYNLYDTEGNELIFENSLTVYRGALTRALIDKAGILADSVMLFESELKKQSLFYGLLFELTSLLARKRQEYFPIVHGAERLSEEWMLNKKIKEYAELSGLSEAAFYTYFKMWCGHTPVEYRNNIRINAARSLLLNTNLPIAAIALRCGFDDPYYFSRIFKKLEGMSPREYRVTHNMLLYQ